MNNFQENIDDRWEMIPSDFNVTSKTFPFVFHHNYEKYKLYENSNKIIASKILLYQLSKYENLVYPIHVKIDPAFIKDTDKEDSTIFTIMDFCEETDAIYMPNNFYQQIDVDMLLMSDNNIKFNIVNTPLQKATKITLKPFRSSFYQIPNPKQYLEIHMKRNYTVLRENQIISLIFKDSFLDFDITSLTGGEEAEAEEGAEENKKECYSIIDTDIEVLFEKSYDYVEPATFHKVDTSQIKPKDSYAAPDSEEKQNLEEDSSCKRFPGKGNRLGN